MSAPNLIHKYDFDELPCQTDMIGYIVGHQMSAKGELRITLLVNDACAEDVLQHVLPPRLMGLPRRVQVRDAVPAPLEAEILRPPALEAGGDDDGQ